MRKRKLKLIFLGLGVFCLFFAGIIRHDIPTERYLELAKQKKFDCVGKLFKDTVFEGSCVLIGDRYVLTAAHCLVINTENRDTTIEFNGQIIKTYIEGKRAPVDAEGIYISILGEKIEAKRLIIHPNYLKKKGCDIALIELEKPFKGVVLPKINLSYDELRSEVTGVGYGVFCVSDKPEDVIKGYKIAGQNVIDSISGAEYLGHKTLLLFDFDHPNDTTLNRMGSVIPQPLEYKVNGGDSGGGLFRENKGAYELIGICAGGGLDLEYFMKSRTYYGQISEFTRVSVFYNWIEENMK
jgi:hypothetical protein